MTRPALAVLAAVLAAAPACRPAALVPVSVDLPVPAVLPPGSVAEVVVAEIRDDAPDGAFRPGRELAAYLEAELRRAFKGRVSRLDGAPGPPGGPEGSVILTGSVRVRGRVRKALQPGAAPADGPFKTEGRALLERRRWSLEFDLLVVSAASGRTLQRLASTETRDYIDLDKPVETAFFDLADGVRARLLRVLVARPSAEKRVLLRR